MNVVLRSREQLSTLEGLWCIDDCAKEKEGDFYRCTTLLGRDYCSPQRDTTTKGKLMIIQIHCYYNKQPCSNFEYDMNSIGGKI